MKKITVGLFNDSFFPMTDGVGVVVDNYARRLCKKCKVVVFVPGYGKYDDEAYPYKIVRCKSIKVPFLDYSLPLPLLDFRFRREVRNSHLDLIHIHSPFTIGKYGVKFGKKNKLPVIGTMHSQYKQDFARAVRGKWLINMLTRRIVKVFNSCTKCFAVNSGMAHLYYSEYGVKELPGVLSNATEMKPVVDVKAARKRINSMWKLSDKEKVFLFVGRINKLKNIYFIADSLVLLKKKYSSFKMLFVGDGGDALEFKKYIKRKNLSDFVIFCGNVEDRDLLKDYYVRSDLFLFPSLYDASSIVQIEAASQKTPGVFLAGSMTASDIKDRVNGFLAQDLESFADTIYEAVTNEKIYNKVAMGAFVDVYRDWDTIVENVYKMYLKMIRER